jgi:parvulin-like peptidyl-prolyl isomerase
MEFLSQGTASNSPSGKDLQEYFQANRDKFRIPAQVAFTHIYFSSSRHGSRAETDASRALAGLKAERSSSAQISPLGDPFMLQSEYPLQTQQQVKELFGESFAEKLFQLDSSGWAGPIRSGYGVHLVRILQKSPSRVPELDEVYSQVLSDYRNHSLQASSEAFYAQLRKRYQVDIDATALSAASSQQSEFATTNSRAQGAVTLDGD